MNIRKLRQKFGSDCFPTCVAMVAGLSHDQALKATHPDHLKGEQYTTTTRKGIDVLRRLGFKVNPHIYCLEEKSNRIKKISDIKKPAIISIVWKTGSKKGCGHVVVWDPVIHKIYDPAFKNSLPHSLYLKNMRYYLEISK